MGPILSTLFTSDVPVDGAGKPVPLGAEYLPSLRDGTWKVDGNRMRSRWRIKPRYWHDGRPVTCGDYVFSQAVARNPRVPLAVTATTGLSTKIASVSCPGGASAREIVVDWNERYPFAHLMITEFGPLPRHLLEQFYRQNPSRLNEAPFGMTRRRR